MFLTFNNGCFFLQPLTKFLVIEQPALESPVSWLQHTSAHEWEQSIVPEEKSRKE